MDEPEAPLRRIVTKFFRQEGIAGSIVLALVHGCFVAGPAYLAVNQ